MEITQLFSLYKEGKYIQAQQQCQELKNKLSDTHDLGSIAIIEAKICEKFGKYKEAEKIANELEKSNISPYHTAYALQIQSYCMWRFGEYEIARMKIEKAQRILVDNDISNGELNSAISHLEGNIKFSTGDNKGAVSSFKQVIESRKGDTISIDLAATQNNLGTVYRDMGDFQQAVQYFQDSLETYTALGDTRGSAYPLNNLGIVNFHQGNFEVGLKNLQKALDIR